MRYLEGRGSGRGLLAHIAACPECRIVVEASLEVRDQAGGLLQGLEGLAPEAPPGAARSLRRLARREIRLLRRTERPGHRALPRWLAIPAAGAALALLAAVFVFLPARHPGRRGGLDRGASVAEVGLVRPRGSVPAAGLDFRWTRETGVGQCRLEIYDQTLEPIYESPPLTQDHAVLPAAALGSLERGAVYYWKVVATLENGQTIASGFASFTIQK